MFRTYKPSRKMRTQNAQAGMWQYMTASAGLSEVSHLSSYSSEDEISDSADLTSEPAQAVFGFMYHTGPQCLSVSVPGDVAPVRFNNHALLSGIKHEEQSSDIIIDMAGVYEISYSLILSAATTAHAAFSLQADGEKLEGSIISCLVSPEQGTYSTTALAELKKNTALRVIMTSGSTFNAELSESGVSASMTIRKVNE